MGLFKYFTVKKQLEIEISHLKSIIDIEKNNLQSRYDILATKKTMELDESIRISRMEMEHKLNKQATLYSESLQKMELLHAQKIATLQSNLAKQYYDKMADALCQMNLEGNSQTKFVQDLSLKMFDKALEKPMPSHIISEQIISSRSAQMRKSDEDAFRYSIEQQGNKSNEAS